MTCKLTQTNKSTNPLPHLLNENGKELGPISIQQDKSMAFYLEMKSYMRVNSVKKINTKDASENHIYL